MKKNTALTAKTFLTMAEADRKLITVTSALNTVLSVSLCIKLAVAALCFIKAVKS